jgi:hypothetical protein
VATAAPGADGPVRHGRRARARRQRFGTRLGAPAARPCDAGRTRRPAAAVPVRGTLAGAGAAARPFRPGRPWSPGRAGARGRSRAARAIRSCPAVGARPAPRLGRTVRPGPRPEPGIGARAEPGLRTATGPGIWSWSRPAGAGPGIRPGPGAGARAETLIGVTGPPRARGVLEGLRARRGGERDAGRRTIARSSQPARTRFRANASRGTRPAAGREATARTGTRDPARVCVRDPARIRTRSPAQTVTRDTARVHARIRARTGTWDPARVGTGIPVWAGAKARIHAWAGSRDGTARRTRIQARIAGQAQQRVQAGVPARAGPARHTCVTAKARVTAITWVSAEAWVTGARVRAGTEVAATGRLVPSVGIGCPAIRGRILIGDGGGQAPARVPRGLRTAVAHAPSPVPGHLAGCRRDLLEVSPS